MPELDPFHWAGKISRRDIQRLYDSEARGLLDEDLLNQVLFGIHARVLDMFEVRQAQKTGRVTCRSCGAPVPQPYRMGRYHKASQLHCPACGWQTTCGDFYASYTGKDMLPGSRTDLFQDFLARFPTAQSAREKMLLLDWLIHAFHIQSGVAGRMVAQNVIQGSRAQLTELLNQLASAEGGQAENDNPIRRFRRKCRSHARVLAVAARLGIKGRDQLPEDELIAEILRLAPDLGGEG